MVGSKRFWSFQLDTSSSLESQTPTARPPSSAGPTATWSAGSEAAGRQRKLSVGDTVRIEGQHTVGRIQTIAGKTARVLFGMMYTNVPLRKLVYAEPPAAPAAPVASTFVSKQTRDAMYEKKLQFRPEIDIRGMRVDEALRTVSYFMDDAIQLEQSRVRILHGTGTGALRELVRNYLATVPGVKAFRAT